MQNLNSLIKLLGENYYVDFIIEPDAEEVDYDIHYLMVRYNNVNYYELIPELIGLKQSKIINDCMQLFKNAISEIYIELASKDEKGKINFLNSYIEAFNQVLKTLKDDFYVYDVKSRYYSLLIDDYEIVRLENTRDYNIDRSNLDYDQYIFLSVVDRIYPLNHHSIGFDEHSIYDIETHHERYKRLTFLPFRLFLIGQNFVVELEKIKYKIQKQIIEESENQLSINNKNNQEMNNKVDNSYFAKFCEMIDDVDILSKSTVIGVMIDLQLCIKEIKSETFSALLEKGDSRNDYLDYLINEVEKRSYSKNADIKYIKKWIDKYQFSLTDLFNNSIQDNPLYLLISSNYKELDKYSEETLNVYYLQLDFYQYLCKYYADEIIAFFEGRKTKTATNSDILSNEINETIKWIGKPSQLGFIIGKLAELGYIEAPIKPNGDTNYTQFANLVNNTFDVSTTKDTLSKYLNLESEKGQETERKFDKNGFNIPHIKEIS